MRKFAFAAALLAGTIATPALAQDTANVGGFHVDAHRRLRPRQYRGRGHERRRSTASAPATTSAPATPSSASRARPSDSTGDECFTTGAIVGDELCVGAGRDLYVGGRVGAVVGGNTLLYAKAGYTNARVNVAYDDGTAATGPDFAGHSNLDGVRVGGGAQFGIGPNTYIRTEYRYSNYQDGFDRHQVVGGFGFRF